MRYLILIYLISKLVAIILIWIFRRFQANFPKSAQRIKKSVVDSLQKVIIFPIFILIAIFVYLFSLLNSIYRYVVYFHERQEARNPETEPERLKKLAEVRDPVTQRWVTANLNTPPDVLLKLGERFPQELLMNPVFDLLLLEDVNLFATMPRATLKRLLALNNIPPGFLERSAAIPALGVEVARVIAQHPNATEYAFEKIARYSEDATIARCLIERSRLSEVILQHMKSNAFLGIIQYLAQRSKFPKHVLENIERNVIDGQNGQLSPVAILFLGILAQNGSPQMQTFLVQQNLPAPVLEVLAQYGTEQVWLNLVQQPTLPVSVLKKLEECSAARPTPPRKRYFTRCSKIRKLIAQHPHAAPELLQNLAQDTNASVRQLALQRLAQQQRSAQ